MNKNLQDALRKQRLKSDIKKKVKKTKELQVESSLYTTFVEPFSDVFDALKISSKEIVSNLMMVTGQVLAFTPGQQERRMKKYEERQKKIADQWKPIMDRADEALSTGDADIAALAFAPGLYAVSALGAKTYNAAEGIGSYLDDLGLKKGFLSVLPGVSAGSETEKKDDSEKDSEKKGSLLDRIGNLFLGTALASGVGAELIQRYQDSQKKSQKKESVGKRKTLTESAKDFVKDMDQYLEDTGLSTEFEKMQKQIIQMYSEMIKDYDKDFEEKKSIANAIASSTSLEEMTKALRSLGVEGIEDQIREIEGQVKESVLKLVKSDEFINKLKEELGKEEITEDEAREAAIKSSFGDFVSSMKSSLSEKLETVKTEIGKNLEQMLPPEETLSLIRKTKAGLSLFNMIRDAKARYNIS